MIAGFIVLNGNQKVIVRAIGPSLPVSGALQDPVLELHDQDGNVTLNDNWRTGGQQAQIIATTVPSGDDRESAIVGTLAPGNYTAIVRGANNTSGIALVEVFALQQQVSPLQQTAAPLHIPAPSRTTEPVISLVVAAVSYRWPVSNYALLS
jgi:hypothetical protein